MRDEPYFSIFCLYFLLSSFDFLNPILIKLSKRLRNLLLSFCKVINIILLSCVESILILIDSMPVALNLWSQILILWFQIFDAMFHSTNIPLSLSNCLLVFSDVLFRLLLLHRNCLDKLFLSWLEVIKEITHLGFMLSLEGLAMLLKVIGEKRKLRNKLVFYYLYCAWDLLSQHSSLFV